MPYYLTPTNVPLPDNASGFAQELWIRNTPRGHYPYIYRPQLPIYTRPPYSCQVKFSQISINFLPLLSAGPKETGPKVLFDRIEGAYCGDYVFSRNNTPAKRGKKKK
jgi:hypothetical protein